MSLEKLSDRVAELLDELDPGLVAERILYDEHDSALVYLPLTTRANVEEWRAFFAKKLPFVSVQTHINRLDETRQIHVRIPGEAELWARAERAASTHLGPQLLRAANVGVLSAFVVALVLRVVEYTLETSWWDTTVRAAFDFL